MLDRPLKKAHLLHGLFRRAVKRLLGVAVAIALPTALLTRTWAAEIALEADSISYEQEGKVVWAEGNVSISWDNSRLEAGSVRYEQDGSRAMASSGLRFLSPDIEVVANSADLLLDDETGLLENVVARVPGRNLTFGGRRVEKRLGRRYRIRDGYFTTCEHREGEQPDWEITGAKVDLELDGYATVSNGSVKLKGLPVVYLPYAIFPVKQHRQSGLLAPRLGTSNERGLIYTQPFFWAIDKKQDVTFAFDVETSARLGVAAEYRYRPSRAIRGNTVLEYFNESIRGDQESEIVSPALKGRHIPNDRLKLEGSHRQRLGSDTDFYADYLVVSDDLYLREVNSIGTGATERRVQASRRYTDSHAGLLARDGFVSYGMRASGYQDFYGPSGSKRFTLQRPLGGWFKRDGSLGAFSYQVDALVDAFQRRRGSDGQRLHIESTFGLPLVPGSAIDSRIWARGRVTGYNMDNRDFIVNGSVVLPKIDATPLRGVVEAGADARTVFERYYAFGERGLELRHTIEPFASYRHTGNSDSRGLPFYDSLDRVDGRSVATMGLESRFLEKIAGDEQHERLRLAVAQSYNLDDAVLEDHFSDIDLAVAVTPSEGMSLTGLSSYNMSKNVLTGAVAALDYETSGLALIGGRRVKLLGAYHYVRGGVTESLRTRASVGVSRRISVTARADYDFVSERLLEKGLSMRWGNDCDCWALDVGVLSSVNPDELQLRVMIELSGVGSLGASATGRGQSLLGYLADRESSGWRSGW